MDLKQLLNQTTVGIETEEKEEETRDTELVETEVDTTDIIESSTEPVQEVDETTETLDPRFTNPWNKLEKGSKMNRILLFVEKETLENNLSESGSKELKKLLFKGCENGLFNKVTDVKYDENTGIIESFKNLEFNESTKKYKLKTGGTKNRSVSKSRSNIDRLTKKK